MAMVQRCSSRLGSGAAAMRVPGLARKFWTMISWIRRMGAFGLKIPKEYGGKGFDQVEYAQAMELIGSHDGNLSALLSAHQSIGVPQPVKLFGTKEQCQEYLPRCARGEISAFALTEQDVGSDPARLATTAELEGDFYVLNGRKLWCTNGTIVRVRVNEEAAAA